MNGNQSDDACSPVKVLTKDKQYVYLTGNKNSNCFKRIVKKINSSTLEKYKREVLGKANEKLK